MLENVEKQKIISQKERNEKIAKEACNYSRSIIKEGTTHKDFNEYKEEEKARLNNRIRALRGTYDQMPDYLLEFKEALRKFYRIIEKSTEFGLGNCEELGRLSLHYITQNSDCHAEALRVMNGDHVFLVVGRELNSDPYDPLTWGENAYVCDPWADDVYQASGCLAKIKGYHSGDNKIDTNKLRPVLIPNLNSEYLRKTASEHIAQVISTFEIKTVTILSGLTDLENDLSGIAERMETKYGSQDKKLAIIKKLIKQVKATKESVFNKYNQLKIEPTEKNYIKIRTKLENDFKTILTESSKLTKLMKKDEKILKKNRSFKEGICEFFGMKKGEYEEVKLILEKNKKTIEKSIAYRPEKM